MGGLGALQLGANKLVGSEPPQPGMLKCLLRVTRSIFARAWLLAVGWEKACREQGEKGSLQFKPLGELWIFTLSFFL